MRKIKSDATKQPVLLPTLPTRQKWGYNKTNMQALPNLILCEECDALYQKPEALDGHVTQCNRCGAEMDRYAEKEHFILPLTIASLLMFVMANSMPIAALKLQGLESHTTLLGAVFSLMTQGDWLFALLVLATTFVFPLMQLCLLLYTALGMWWQRKNKRVDVPLPYLDVVMRMMYALRPWSMIEVFMLSMMVAIIKLAGRTLILGPAIWAFVALTILLSLVLSFNQHSLWHINVNQLRR